MHVAACCRSGSLRGSSFESSVFSSSVTEGSVVHGRARSCALQLTVDFPHRLSWAQATTTTGDNVISLEHL